MIATSGCLQLTHQEALVSGCLQRCSTCETSGAVLMFSCFQRIMGLVSGTPADAPTDRCVCAASCALLCLPKRIWTRFMYSRELCIGGCALCRAPWQVVPSFTAPSSQGSLSSDCWTLSFISFYEFFESRSVCAAVWRLQ